MQKYAVSFHLSGQIDGCNGAHTWPRAFMTARAAFRHQKQFAGGAEREPQISPVDSGPPEPSQFRQPS